MTMDISLSNSLVAEFSKKILTDDIELENTSKKTLYSKIAAEYEMICFNEWYDAKNTLENIYPELSEEKRVKILTSVFEISEVEANTMLQTVFTQAEQIWTNPSNLNDDLLSQTTNIESGSQGVRSILPNRNMLKTSFCDFLIRNTNVIDVEKLVQIVSQKTGVYGLRHITSQSFCKFVEAAVRLCLEMVHQIPPMYFMQNGVGQKWQGDSKQDIYWNSSSPYDPNSRVKYYLHPALYHGDILMVKGNVFLSTKSCPIYDLL